MQSAPSVWYVVQDNQTAGVLLLSHERSAPALSAFDLRFSPHSLAAAELSRSHLAASASSIGSAAPRRPYSRLRHRRIRNSGMALHAAPPPPPPFTAGRLPTTSRRPCFSAGRIFRCSLPAAAARPRNAAFLAPLRTSSAGTATGTALCLGGYGPRVWLAAGVDLGTVSLIR